jgi:hypothetical protein
MASNTLTLSRALLGLIGAGALVMAISGLTSGESLTDPVFPGGLALGVLSLGAVAWVEAPGVARAAVTWLGLAAVVATIAIFGFMAAGTPSPDVIALFAIPSVIVLAVVGRMVAARMAAGPTG